MLAKLILVYSFSILWHIVENKFALFNSSCCRLNSFKMRSSCLNFSKLYTETIYLDLIINSSQAL